MNILDKIIETKKQEVIAQKKVVDVSRLKEYPAFRRSCNSLSTKLLGPESSGIIAEFKQKSPSKGIINADARVEEVTRAYVESGASCLSVLTDTEYFGGSLSNLEKARKANPQIPILRKEFMIDPYQVTEAKAWGADVILLIAACLSNKQARELAHQASELGMEVLMEVHNEKELEIVNEFVHLVGINNRDLKTFTVDIETSVTLARSIPEEFIKISESGLSGAREINYLKSFGFKGFLIGETFMKTTDPGKACKNLIDQL